MYIFKVVWFGFGPVAQTTTRVSCAATILLAEERAHQAQSAVHGVGLRHLRRRVVIVGAPFLHNLEQALQTVAAKRLARPLVEIDVTKPPN